jgi:acyl-CoA thioester hydrolase
MVVYEHTFRVRHYECDAYGHVNHAQYVRWMQEAALAASTAVNYPISRYEAMGRQWWVHETDVTYLTPLAYGDTVQVQTWVENFRRARSRRVYELRVAATGELAATASSDWVFLETARRRPVRVPPEMMAAFLPDGSLGENKPEPFPAAPPPPPGKFSLRRLVEWRDIDPAQHVNNSVYLAYIEDCGVQVAAHFGWSMLRMVAHGFGIMARRYRIQYLQPALMGDEVETTTWISEVKRATAVRHYTITRVGDGTLLARAHVLWVWVNLKNGRPIRIPPDFLASFTPNMVAL